MNNNFINIFVCLFTFFTFLFQNPSIIPLPRHARPTSNQRLMRSLLTNRLLICSLLLLPLNLLMLLRRSRENLIRILRLSADFFL